MSSQEEASDNISIPDLIVNECLFGCEGCPAIWENGQTGHRIICKCDCGHVRHKKNDEKVMLQGASLVGSHTARQAAEPFHRLTPSPTSLRLMEVAEVVE